MARGTVAARVSEDPSGQASPSSPAVWRRSAEGRRLGRRGRGSPGRGRRRRRFRRCDRGRGRRRRRCGDRCRCRARRGSRRGARCRRRCRSRMDRERQGLLVGVVDDAVLVDVSVREPRERPLGLRGDDDLGHDRILGPARIEPVAAVRRLDRDRRIAAQRRRPDGAARLIRHGRRRDGELDRDVDPDAAEVVLAGRTTQVREGDRDRRRVALVHRAGRPADAPCRRNCPDAGWEQHQQTCPEDQQRGDEATHVRPRGDTASRVRGSGRRRRAWGRRARSRYLRRTRSRVVRRAASRRRPRDESVPRARQGPCGTGGSSSSQRRRHRPRGSGR